LTTIKVTQSLFALSQNMAEVPSHHRWVYDRCCSGMRGLMMRIMKSWTMTVLMI